MKPDTPLDYAVFQLSPRHSRCELFVTCNGNTEKLASGLVKPFVAHLKVAEEQVARAVRSFKLEVESRRNAETWFTKGTLERFVRFVSTPEVLEMVHTFDAEMSQLEGARKIYSQGTGDQLSGALGGDGTGKTSGADATKKELLRAIDVRLTAVGQDLTTACARASAAGFNPETVSELQFFSDRFGAHRLNEACTKFISVCERRLHLISPWKPVVEDQVVRASWGSDMSIDDPSEEPSGSHNVRSHHHQFHNKQHTQAGQEQQQPDLTQAQDQLKQSKQTSSVHPNSSLLSEQVLAHREKEQEKKEEPPTEPLPIPSSQPVRRLSVQDRINLFENKQKESSGGKPAAATKPAELRRLSSDVSSASALDKGFLLRRWSGASDMSIDLGNDKKDNNSTDSPSCTPSSPSVSQSKSNVFPNTSGYDNGCLKGLNDASGSDKAKAKSVSVGKDQNESQARAGGFVGKEDEAGLTSKTNWKDQVESQPQLRLFTSKSAQVGIDQGVREENFKVALGGNENSSGVKDQGGFEEKSRVQLDRGEVVVANSQAGSWAQIGNFAGRPAAVESVNRVEDAIIRDYPQNKARVRSSQAHTRSLSGQFEGGFGSRVKDVSSKESDSDHSASLPEWQSFSKEPFQGGKDTVVSAKELPKGEDPEVPRMKVHKPLSSAQRRRDESGSTYGSTKLVFSSNKGSEDQESFGNAATSSVEQVQRVRQSKGNQELNDELKMKANELEKLFAEHKQSGSTRRSKPSESLVEPTINTQYRKPAAVETTPTLLPNKTDDVEPIIDANDNCTFGTPPPVKIHHQDYSSSLRQNFSELSLSDDSRGKFYDRYMQKRDAKLREEWSTKRAEKEAKLKAMQDSLEQSRAEMKTKFSGSSGRSTSANQRAEKLRMYHSRSSIKREQHPIDSLQSEEDEDASDFLEQKQYRQDRSFGEASLMDGASKSSQNKKLMLNRNLASTTPRTTAAPIPRSSGKTSNPGSGRRKTQAENLLAQSVPNFSDFRKENTKPSSGVSKTANRTQMRTYARSKSTAEETHLSKEDKPRRSQSLRKSTASPAEFKDFSLNSDDVLAPLTFDKEQTEQGRHEKFSKNLESKHFLRKGNGIGPGAGSSIAKLKASMASEALKDDEEYEELPFDGDDSVNEVKEEDVDEEEMGEDLETTEMEDYVNNGNGKSRASQESDKMSESENEDSLRSLSQIDPPSVAELPASVPSAFHTVGSLQESPGASPVSWNSRMLNPFSYPHEVSDIDASMDSPMGSPASWNSHSLTQTEADAARMRKKWGSAQKPILAAHSSHNQARKDMTKGFKRLLKFGRKSRGTENMVDWISATTSEGDDDTEDGRDPANRSSEDLRKSRMGFSQSQSADDGFNDRELFSEQVQSNYSSIPAPPANFRLRDDHMSGSSIKAPRSFFSLSTFRSKGSESKLR